MDLGSFAFGVVVGAVVVILALSALVAWKLRRLARNLPLLDGFRGAARLRPSGAVETDAEGFIVTSEES